MRAIFNGAVVAESDDVVLVEGNAYFPPESVEMSLLRRSKLVTPCFWKGLARYQHVVVGGSTARNAAWCYPHPFPWIGKIRDYVAFWGPVRIEP